MTDEKPKLNIAPPPETKMYTLDISANPSRLTQPEEENVQKGFIYRSLTVGEKRQIAFSMFEDFMLTFSAADKELMSRILGSEQVTELSDLYIKCLEGQVELTSSEVQHIARVAAAIVKFNGQQIGEGITTAEELNALQQKRLDAYKNTDMGTHGRTTTLSDIQSEGIVMCAEAALVAQALENNLSGYSTVAVDAVSQANTESAGGHVFNIMISQNGERVVLVDYAYSVVVSIDEEVIGMPFVCILNEDQIRNLEEGMNVELSSMGVVRSYRIGTAHTSEGTWKSKLVDP
jgi:hypothetical protein